MAVDDVPLRLCVVCRRDEKAVTREGRARNVTGNLASVRGVRVDAADFGSRVEADVARLSPQKRATRVRVIVCGE